MHLNVNHTFGTILETAVAPFKIRAETAPAMAIQLIIFSLFQPFLAILSQIGLIGGNLDLFGAIKSYLELFGATWGYLDLFGVIWSYFKLLEAI